MRAMFLTTTTVDCANHVQAWNSVSSEPALHVRFDHIGPIRNDWILLAEVERERPEVVFYIGPVGGIGTPRWDTFQAIRALAPFINLCSDAADEPWHRVLADYRERECFTLQVALDGATRAPVDLATLTPVDSGPFLGDPPRDIACGFSGSVGRWDQRSEVISALEGPRGLTVRRREGEGTYTDHARFMRRCRMILNLSWTGTGHAHHVKGRVLEAGWAGCALLEHRGSPIGEWFPEDCYLSWGSPKEAAEIISDTPGDLIEAHARRLADVVRERYGADQIYGQILEAAHVDNPFARATA
jgi:hypothetical protein